MSGLNSYYNTLNTYGSNLDGMTNFLGQYQQDALDSFNDKVAAVKEQGKALVETGGAIEGQYAAGKVLYKSIKAYRNRGKKPGNEDGDEDDADDADTSDPPSGGDSTNTSDTNLDDAGDSTGADASATGDAGESEVPGTGDGTPVTDADVPSGAGGATDTGDVGSLGQSDTPLTQSQASQFTADPEPEAPAQPAAPEPTGYEPPDIPENDIALPKGLSSGGELQSVDSTGASTGEASTLADGTAEVTATDTAVGDVVSTAVTEVGSDIGAGLLATAGVAAEAVPVLGGLAAIGIGLYELFHHHSKPAPMATPTSLISQKGEMVVPSFDSVTDTPASQAAF